MGAVKDLVLVGSVLGALLGALFLYAGTWPPAVIVESGSMMHPDDDVSYGRFGTIDPGDLVLVKRVDDPADVTTWADRADARYGDWGDVIVYRADGSPLRTPIIHRALAWVVVDASSSSARYVVRWAEDAPCPSAATRSADGRACTFGTRGITVPAWGADGYQPAHSGFITKGDNPVSNRAPDEVLQISATVKPEWVVGAARGELPWLGLIKLALAPDLNQNNAPASWVQVGNAVAPRDLWTMLAVSVGLLVVLPPVVDNVTARFKRESDGGDA